MIFCISRSDFLSITTKGLIFFAALLVVTPSYAQVNIKIGYQTGIGQFGTNNDILSSYTPTSGELREGFPSLHFMHGLHLGLRYRVSNFGIELSWETMSRDRGALLFDPSGEIFTDREYAYRIGGFSLGIDQYFGKIALGMAVSSRKFSVKRRINSNDLDLVNENRTGLDVHLMWLVQTSTQVSFALKPYYQFSVGDYEINNLVQDLSIVDPLPNYAEPASLFGLSFIFYNGPQ